MKKTLIFAMVLVVLALAMTACSKPAAPAPTEAPVVATEAPAVVETEAPVEAPVEEAPVVEAPAEEPTTEPAA